MVPLHHRTKLTESGEKSPPVPPPPPQRGKGEDAPSENCAKKRRVGKNYVHLFTLYCMEVTSLCVLLEIGGHTDGDGENLPAPVFLRNFLRGRPLPYPVVVGGEERGEIFLPLLLASSDDAKEPLLMK